MAQVAIPATALFTGILMSNSRKKDLENKIRKIKNKYLSF